MNKKIAIVGSRSYADVNKIIEYVSKLPPGTVIVSGGAIGVDSIAEKEAKKRGLQTLIFLAKWDDLSCENAIIKVNKYGKKYDAFAGMRRNQDIVDAADEIVAFWDGISPGTKSTIAMAKKAGKPVTIFS